MSHRNIETALFVMVVILMGMNVWQTFRVERAVAFCHQFFEIMTKG